MTDPFANACTHDGAGEPPFFRPRIASLLAQLSDQLVERNEALRLTLLAYLAGEHILLAGDPGSGRAAVARFAAAAILPLRVFEPELEGEYAPQNYEAPYSVVAFVEHALSANQPTVATMMKRHSASRRVCGAPTIVSVVGSELDALHYAPPRALRDGFLLRVALEPVSKEGFVRLMRMDDDIPPSIADPLHAEDLAVLRERARDVHVPLPVIEHIAELREWTQQHLGGISDGTWRRALALLKMAAASNDQAEVRFMDTWLLRYCLATDGEDERALTEWFTKRAYELWDRSTHNPAQFLRELDAHLWISRVTIDDALLPALYASERTQPVESS